MVLELGWWWYYSWLHGNGSNRLFGIRNVILSIKAGFEAYLCFLLVNHFRDLLDGEVVECEFEAKRVSEVWQRYWVEGLEEACKVTVDNVGSVLGVLPRCDWGIVD